MQTLKPEFKIPIVTNKMEFLCEIVGLTPYMQDRMDTLSLQEWEKARGHIIERKDANIPYEDRADFASYHHINPDGSLSYYFPTEHLRQALIEGGKYVKAKMGNAKRNMSNIVSGMFYIKEQEIELPKWDILDARTAVNHNNNSRIVKYRPMWSQWGFQFVLEVRDPMKTITKESIVEIFFNAGTQCGVGNYRVNHKGQFGQFALTYLERIDIPDVPGNVKLPEPAKRRGRPAKIEA